MCHWWTRRVDMAQNLVAADWTNRTASEVTLPRPVECNGYMDMDMTMERIVILSFISHMESDD